ncbi:MAG: exodeoxyribonuclease V subunit gamma [Syntrophaceae bacterium]|nr:exodeoxyribonuclease V subunit gamma [Syntrophaceae bacterium]
MPGLILHTSNRLEILADRLAEALDAPSADPFQAEVILVQSRGMERWVSLELAKRHGVAANLRFPFPNHFVQEVFRAVLGDAAGGGKPDSSPFDPAVMAWEIMGLLPACLDRPGFGDLRGYLGEAERDLRLYQLSGRIADLFDLYLLFRPDWIRNWEKGDDNHWQAALWRELATRKGSNHRATMFTAFRKALANPAFRPAGLPPRVSVFGISALPPFHIEVLATLSAHADVHLFVMNPCREYWGDIVPGRRLARDGGDGTELHLEEGNPLLASLGTLGRDFFDLLETREVPKDESYEDPGEGTLLATLQSDILNLRERGKDGERTLIPPGDRSVEIVSCHSPMREVEVLQDRLLALFEENPGLEPRDILVMTPDLGLYAPYVQAVFSLPPGDPRRIPFSIADRSLPQDSPAAEAFFRLLDLAGSRLGAPDVLDLLEAAPVRSRFGLSEEDLERVAVWIRESGIRWGRDAVHRAALGLPEIAENTWRAGLDRLLLGYALTARDDDAPFLGIVPYDRIEGGEAEILARFLGFTDALFRIAAEIDRPRPPADWSRFLAETLDAFLSRDDDPLGEIETLYRTITELEDLAAVAGFAEPVGPAVVRDHLRERLGGKGFGFGFLAGGITFCAMLPMRSIPFRVLCLLGMNDGAYPRVSVPLGFDLMAQSPRRGDRSRRQDDRYLFLESLLSAREKLYISYTGQGIRDNASRPPSVLVSELLDVVESGFVGPEGGDLRDRLVTRHPLQAFSPLYFGGDERFVSYSPENGAAALRAAGRRTPPEDFLPSDLSEPEPEWRTVDLNALASFFANPARFLLSRRLGLRLVREEEPLEEAEPFALGSRERYSVLQYLLGAARTGTDPGNARDALRAAGLLPHGAPGFCRFDDLWGEAAALLAAVRPHTEGGPAEPLVLDLAIGEFRLTGRIGNVFAGGPVSFRPAKITARDRLRAWIAHLAGHAAGRTAWRSVLVGRDGKTRFYGEPENPEAALATLLELYGRGLLRPLPFFPESSLEYAVRSAKTGDSAAALAAAFGRWNAFKYPEKDDSWYGICFRGASPLEDETFGPTALAVYNPLLESEEA